MRQAFNAQKKLFINNWYKFCLKAFTNNNDPNFLNNLLGLKYYLYTFIDPFYFRRLLIKIVKSIKAFKNSQTKIIFVTNFSNFLLEKKFNKICYKNKAIHLNSLEFIPGFLTNTNKIHNNSFILTLFLKPEDRFFIILECQRSNIPLIEFSDLLINKFSSSFIIPGEFKNFFAQNLIISLISLSFHQYKKNVNNFQGNKKVRLQKNKYFFKQSKKKSISKKSSKKKN